MQQGKPGVVEWFRSTQAVYRSPRRGACQARLGLPSFELRRCRNDNIFDSCRIQNKNNLPGSSCTNIERIERKRTLSEAGISLIKYGPMTGTFCWFESAICSFKSVAFKHTCMISFRTLGISAKKNNAKTPATPPKAPRVNPLSIVSLDSNIASVSSPGVELVLFY